jgi:putative membrane protein
LLLQIATSAARRPLLKAKTIRLWRIASFAFMHNLFSGLVSFIAYFAGAIGYCAVFGLVYTHLTPHHEFDLIVRQHNASAALAFGGSLIGFAIALAGAIHNTATAAEFIIWGFVAFATQIFAYFLAGLAHPGLSHAIEQNAVAAALWVAAVSVAAGLISAACMSP